MVVSPARTLADVLSRRASRGDSARGSPVTRGRVQLRDSLGRGSVAALLPEVQDGSRPIAPLDRRRRLQSTSRAKGAPSPGCSLDLPFRFDRRRHRH